LRAPIELLKVNDPDVIAPYSPPFQGQEYLKGTSDRYLPVSVQISHSVELGKPAEVIVDRAGAERGALIAMATHGLSGIQRWLLGSVASKVLQRATNPVLLVRPVEGAEPAKPIHLNTVLVPLDGSGYRYLEHESEGPDQAIRRGQMTPSICHRLVGTEP
jgi:Universal stress protein family